MTAFWLLVAVVATSELCENPMQGGAGDPEVCLIHERQLVETPYFSVTIEPGFYVEVDRDGRRLRAQPTLIKELASFEIELFEAADPKRLAGCTHGNEFSRNGTDWRECLRETPDSFERLLGTRVGAGEAVIKYQYASMATPSAPALERMLQSARIRIPAP